MISIDNLKTLLERNGQRFICKPAGGRTGPNGSVFEAAIKHETLPAIEKSELDDLAKKYGKKIDIFELLSSYASVRLFIDPVSDDSAFYICHPDEWAELKAELTEWFEGLDDNEAKELIPDWVESAVVFGEIPGSGNYYLMPLKGDESGKVYEFEHDGFEFIKIGNNFQEFLDYICTVTDGLIDNIGSHTRYSDGVTDIQWLPQRYIYSD